MAGHSKWANIQHRKSRQDVKRSKEFTKAAKEIIIAAKTGGDPLGNPRLRAAIAAAKAVNLPKDKIDAAIRKGTGQEAGGDLAEITYEGYAPGGVAVIIETATDNRNRTIADLRHIMTKNGGSMGESGCVSWMFEQKGVFTFEKHAYKEDVLMELAIESGAEDIQNDDELWIVYTDISNFANVRDSFETKELDVKSVEISMIPKNTITVDEETAQKVLKLLDAIEDYDDVQKVSSNMDIPDALWASLI